ncbi:hypothetical protein JW960_15435 [candidate division KSB1 bacterium]|nr:hypothetical protein [candidate division KSB1 bacterium]
MDIETMNAIDIEIHMMAVAYMWGDYSALHQLVNKNAPAYNAIQSGDVFALRAHAMRLMDEIDNYSDEHQQQLESIHQEIADKYQKELEQLALPLPEKYLEELAGIAIAKGNYATAHSAWNAFDKLDKGVNQYVVKGVELLQSPVLRDEASDPQSFRNTLHEAVEQFYVATRMKNPVGQQFQYLSQQLHMKDQEGIRKYFKYIEAALQKEIVDFAIEYLIDDKNISAKITAALPNAKARRAFLRYLAQKFSRGEQSYAEFLQHYRHAIELFREAKTDDQFQKVQQVMLGRNTAENESYQFLRELAVDHPISTLLVTAVAAADNQVFLVPILMKSEQPLYEFLELDATDA